MWTYIKWGIRLVFFGLVAAFLHYNLPRHDIVRITNAYNRLTEIGSNGFFFASPVAPPPPQGADRRDIRYISGTFPDGSVMVYRNEDTGWIWPPYFKYDSSNLQARASDYISAEQNPRWVRVTRYGWRNTFMSIYPNAVKMIPVSGPDVRFIPWLNIIIITLLIIGFFMIRRAAKRFWASLFHSKRDPFAPPKKPGMWARLTGRS